MEDLESQAEVEVSVIGHCLYPHPLTDLRSQENMDQCDDIRDGKKARVMKNIFKGEMDRTW